MQRQTCKPMSVDKKQAKAVRSMQSGQARLRLTDCLLVQVSDSTFSRRGVATCCARTEECGYMQEPIPCPLNLREKQGFLCAILFVRVSISSFQNKLDSNRLRMANQVAAHSWCFCFITLRHKLSISNFGTVVIGATGTVTIYTNIKELNLRECGQVFLNFVSVNITHLNSINISTKF